MFLLWFGFYHIKKWLLRSTHVLFKIQFGNSYTLGDQNLVCDQTVARIHIWVHFQNKHSPPPPGSSPPLKTPRCCCRATMSYVNRPLHELLEDAHACSNARTVPLRHAKTISDLLYSLTQHEVHKLVLLRS